MSQLTRTYTVVCVGCGAVIAVGNSRREVGGECQKCKDELQAEIDRQNYIFSEGSLR